MVVLWDVLGPDLNISTPQFLGEAATTSDSGRSADQVPKYGGRVSRMFVSCFWSNIHWKTRAQFHHNPSMNHFTAKSLFRTWILQTRRVRFDIALAVGFAVDTHTHTQHTQYPHYTYNVHTCVYIYRCTCISIWYFSRNCLHKRDPTWPNSVTCPCCSFLWPGGSGTSAGSRKGGSTAPGRGRELDGVCLRCLSMDFPEKLLTTPRLNDDRFVPLLQSFQFQPLWVWYPP